MAKPFKCMIVTPEAEVLDTQVIYANVPAHDGQVGIMHLRAPLLVKLGFGPLQLTMPDNSTQVYFVGGGFAQVKDDVLTILTDEACTSDNINATDAEAALKEAQAYLPKTSADQQRKERDIARARGMLAMK